MIGGRLQPPRAVFDTSFGQPVCICSARTKVLDNHDGTIKRIGSDESVQYSAENGRERFAPFGVAG